MCLTFSMNKAGDDILRIFCLEGFGVELLMKNFNEIHEQFLRNNISFIVNQRAQIAKRSVTREKGV